MTVTGKDLIDLGFPQGAALGAALDHVRAAGLEGEALRAFVAANRPAPYLPLQDAPAHALNLEAEDGAEIVNLAKVTETMEALMRTPTVRAGAVMPGACPAGPTGTIPVGGVVVTESAIHPGMHSADICCSVMVTDVADADPEAVRDAVHAATHFGLGRRAGGKRYTMSAEPVLLIRGATTDRNLGFAPHGAGRNLSRKAHKRGLGAHAEAEVLAREITGLDARVWSGNIDVSELPSAYKPAATVRAQMTRFGLAEVVDEIHPHGCILAGDRERDARWRVRPRTGARDGADKAA